MIDPKNKIRISDMGLAKKLEKHQHSFSSQNPGTVGWQAPEWLSGGRQSKKVDIFSLGCVIFYILTNGEHPFGDKIGRESNIMNGNACDLQKLSSNNPEAAHLVSSMISKNPEDRMTCEQVLAHPLFWDIPKKLSFLKDLSDVLEADKNSLVCVKINIKSQKVCKNWDKSISFQLIENMGHYRKYDFNSVVDLMRLIRNKSNHYNQLPPNLKYTVGSHPVGYFNYFNSRFPNLLIVSYEVFMKHSGTSLKSQMKNYL